MPSNLANNAPRGLGSRRRCTGYPYPVGNYRVNARLSALSLYGHLDPGIPLYFVLGILGLYVPSKANLLSRPLTDSGSATVRGSASTQPEPARELQSLRAHYRALAANQTYGICSCRPDGSFLHANDTLVKMLGYRAHDELLAMNVAEEVFNDPAKLAQLLGQSPENANPVEADWARPDGTRIKVRLSAQAVLSEDGQTDSYETIVEDVTKQRELEDHLRRLATIDPLTGLSNYRHLIDTLDKEIRRSNRTGREFALLMFDLDDLKQLNDNFGHLSGSQALCRTADALTLFCRDIDTAARFGGDEFALLLPETGLQAAHSVARRISGSIAEDHNGPRISVSVGIGVFPLNGETPEALVSAADNELYEMKRQRKVQALLR